MCHRRDDRRAALRRRLVSGLQFGGRRHSCGGRRVAASGFPWEAIHELAPLSRHQVGPASRIGLRRTRLPDDALDPAAVATTRP